MICNNCGATISNSTIFCGFCGTKLINEELKPIEKLTNQIKTEVIISDEIYRVRKGLVKILEKGVDSKLIISNSIDSYDIEISSFDEFFTINVLLVNKINIFDKTSYTILKFSSLNLLEKSNDAIDVIKKFTIQIEEEVNKITRVEVNAGLLYPHAFELIKSKNPSFNDIKKNKKIYYPAYLKYQKFNGKLYASDFDSAWDIQDCLIYLDVIKETGSIQNGSKYKLIPKTIDELDDIFKKNDLPTYTTEELNEAIEKNLNEEANFNETHFGVKKIKTNQQTEAKSKTVYVLFIMLILGLAYYFLYYKNSYSSIIANENKYPLSDISNFKAKAFYIVNGNSNDTSSLYYNSSINTKIDTSFLYGSTKIYIDKIKNGFGRFKSKYPDGKIVVYWIELNHLTISNN